MSKATPTLAKRKSFYLESENSSQSPVNLVKKSNFNYEEKEEESPEKLVELLEEHEPNT